MFPMWAESIAPAILAAQQARRVTRHRRLKCFGAGESHLEAMLPDLIRRGREPRVGITVSDTTITLRITASGPDEAACWQAMAPTVAQIRGALGVLVFGEEEDELQHAVARLLDKRHAEWATDGLVAHWLADAAGGSGCLSAGVIVRDAATMESLLGVVEPDLAADPFPAASAAAAEAMARTVRERTGADYGLAVAAWPIARSPASPAADEELDGKLHVAVAVGDNVRVKAYPLFGHPAVLRIRAAKQALNLLRLELMNHQ
jgi:nicotinamide-nucleotide amidase